MSYIFSFEDFEYLQKTLEELFFIKKGAFKTKAFASSEIELELLQEVEDEVCFVLSNVKAHDPQFFKLLLLCSTLKKEKAKKIILISPFFYYARQDKKKPLKSNTLDLISSLLKIAGVDEILTLDLHSQEALNLIRLPIRSLCPQKIFYEALKSINFFPDTLVSPDSSSLKRIEMLKTFFSEPLHICFLTKVRHECSVSHTQISGKYGKKLLIVDDMIDTGSTLYSCLQTLNFSEVDEVVIITTHGLFSENPQKLINHPLVKKIIYLDTLPKVTFPHDDKILQIPHAAIYDLDLEDI
jgi:ribose-phosphate pyrophosphokinase